MIDAETKKYLIELADKYETVDFLNGDPSWFMHQVNGRENIEAMAFVAASLSYGSRKQFLPKIQWFLDTSCGDIHDWIKEGRFREYFSPDDNSCFYRLYPKKLMFAFLAAYRRILEDCGTLGEYVMAKSSDGMSAISAICEYFSGRGVAVIIPKNTESACKRLCMFLRWMVRDNSPVDTGLWTHGIDKRTLVMPLDTHVLQEASKLRLIHSKNATMKAALSLTKVLLDVFPDDPLRGDFALFGLGVDES